MKYLGCLLLAQWGGGDSMGGGKKKIAEAILMVSSGWHGRQLDIKLFHLHMVHKLALCQSSALPLLVLGKCLFWM